MNSYEKGYKFIMDFGNHYVGYVNLKIRAIGSTRNAPLRLKMTFGEMLCEVG